MNKSCNFFSAEKSIHTKYIIACFLSFTLSSCTTQVSPKLSTQDDLKRQLDLSKLDYWTWTGKFVFKQKNTSGLGSLTWRKKGISNYISLKGPIGIGASELLIRQGQVLSYETGAPKISSKEEEIPEELFLDDLPLDSIDLLLLGLVPKNSNHTKRYAGPTVSYRYEDWLVIHKKWREFGGYLLPSETFLKNKLVQIKLVTLDWSSAKHD